MVAKKLVVVTSLALGVCLLKILAQEVEGKLREDKIKHLAIERTKIEGEVLKCRSLSSTVLRVSEKLNASKAETTNCQSKLKRAEGKISNSRRSVDSVMMSLRHNEEEKKQWEEEKRLAGAKEEEERKEKELLKTRVRELEEEVEKLRGRAKKLAEMLEVVRSQVNRDKAKDGQTEKIDAEIKVRRKRRSDDYQ